LADENPAAFENVLIYLNRLGDYLFVAARFANVVHRGDVGVVQRGRHLRFARKAGTEVCGQRGVCEHLERDVPLEARIERLVDVRAASGPEQLEDLVLAQHRSGRKKLAVLCCLEVVDAGLPIEQVNGVVVLFQEPLDFLTELRIAFAGVIEKGSRIRRLERLKIQIGSGLPALVIHSRPCGATG